MKKLKPAVLIMFLAISFTSFSQTDFRPGYIITPEKDTIHGLIDFRANYKLNAVCRFKAKDDADIIEYRPYELTGYKFDDMDKYYVSRIIQDGERERIQFVEYLVDGIIDLFYYNDSQGDHYLIQKNDSSLAELTNESEVKKNLETGRWYKVETNKHIGLLKMTMSDAPELFDEINKAQLSYKSLVRIAEDYHNLKCDTACLIYEKGKESLRWDFAVLGGINLSRLDFFHSPISYKDGFGFSPGSIWGIQVRIMSPKWNDRFFLSTGFMHNNNHYYTSLFHFTNYYETNINSKITRLNFNAGYIYPGGKVRPSLSVGLLENIYNSTTRIIEFATTETTTTYSEVNDDNILNYATGLNVTGGLNYRLSDKMDLLLNLSFKIAYTKIKAYSKAQAMESTFSLSTGILFK